MKRPARASGNALLDQLPKGSRDRLLADAKQVQLAHHQILYEARDTIEQTYFPISAVLSAVVVMRNGAMIEVGTIGNEGGVGVPASDSAVSSANRVIVQIPGDAWQLGTGEVRMAVAKDKALRELFVTYNEAFQFQVSQSVACNGLHPLEGRCARWLLMTHDRVEGDEIGLTHEFLAAMLGVRRAGVGEVLQKLEERGLIANGRSKITIVDRPGLEQATCECYQDVQNEYRRLLG
jgi:CRP-like cAMP-binding protein